MEMTIKELADELGVSKDKIKYRVGKLPSNYLVKKNGVTYLKSEGIKAIREQVVGNSLGNSLGNFLEDYPPFTHYDKMIELLEKELDVLRKQLEEKDKQLDQLHKSLDQSQQLQAMAEQRVKLLEQKEEIEEEPKKKHWWNFGK